MAGKAWAGPRGQADAERESGTDAETRRDVPSPRDLGRLPPTGPVDRTRASSIVTPTVRVPTKLWHLTRLSISEIGQPTEWVLFVYILASTRDFSLSDDSQTASLVAPTTGNSDSVIFGGERRRGCTHSHINVQVMLR